ncbi:hypothetical protein K7432_013645 [Basidiobolus ranarum]|uniref:J domain-containing protein n=1 Tax=Basidiobolus ranarum TaxID=34480 RepID=A0ABR2WJ30_9FUNG
MIKFSILPFLISFLMSEPIKPLKFKEKKKKRKHHKHKREHNSDTKSREYVFDERKTFDEYHEDNLHASSSSFKPDLDWQQHFFDVMAEDEGQDRWDNYFEHRNWRGNGNKIDTLDDEEYREYVVSGMYARRHAAEIEEKKRRDEARKARKRDREEARKKWEKEESKLRDERLRKREIRREVEMEQARKEYYSRWGQVKLDKDELNFFSIPWPTAEVSEKALSSDTFTISSLREFFLSPNITSTEQRKIVRQEQLRWHPDKFTQVFGERFSNGKERHIIQKSVQSISQALNELWASLNTT